MAMFLIVISWLASDSWRGQMVASHTLHSPPSRSKTITRYCRWLAIRGCGSRFMVHGPWFVYQPRHSHRQSYDRTITFNTHV
ncbi:hypothetical protein B0I35DRAFT_103705 [Stachybotrys elegans]|uniref:Secreted protein n=1 Tax=Stachybotrys elegans TaxID=80388 RepID=A0A8K0SFQ5_9HYPO|nr:hypothetical protein B0I35DRAFT_103705 [Stachybotrys elegans]